MSSIIYKSYKFRIYPNNNQIEKINDHFGCCRFVWNYFLNERKEYYLKNKEEIEQKRIKGSLNYYDNCSRLTQIKKEFEWLNKANSQSLQVTLKDLESSYKNFFRKTHKFPKFKSKRNPKQSFKIPQFISFKSNKIYFPKFKEGMNIKIHRKIEGKILSGTLSKTPTGKYFISINCEIKKENIKENKKSDKIIALDLGIKNLVTTSEGDKFDNPKYLIKSQSKLKFIQRKYSKFKSKKSKKKLCLIHEKVKNQRNDFLHKLSSKIVNENQVIIIEDLNVKGMIKNHKLAKSIQDASWSKFVNQLFYKCDWNDKELIEIDRFFPSSKLCSNCGCIKEDLKLSDRIYKCEHCNFEIDRDINASLNLLIQGINKCDRNYRIKPYELPSKEGVMIKEALTFK